MTPHPLNQILAEFTGEISILLPQLSALLGKSGGYPRRDDLWWDTQEAVNALDQVFENLNQLSPEGYAFGGHPLQPQCLGYWNVD